MQLLVVAQGIAGDGREQQQQREDREQPVVGDERRLGPRLVVAEFLDDGEREPDRTMVLLESVRLPDHDGEPLGPAGRLAIARAVMALFWWKLGVTHGT